MFRSVLSATLQGLQVEFVQVEADVSNGLPMFHMVGYLSSEVKEAAERVRMAIHNSDFTLPPKKVVINLSPANMRKRGTVFDLAIGIAVLAAFGDISEGKLSDTIFVGELSLDGKIKGIQGILPIVLAAQKQGYKKCVIPRENQSEGNLVQGIQVIGVSNLREAYEYIGEGVWKFEKEQNVHTIPKVQYSEDFADIKGQHFVKRAVEVAVAGGHNLLMTGPPGAGKTAIAKRIPSILPPLTMEESLELTMIYSIVGKLPGDSPLKVERPFREVNASITRTGLLGGGIYPGPGEISLAHKGVLFLDEIAEFPRYIMESLRKPLEEREMRIVRERGEYCFPADFLLIAAMNPCPCGNYPDLNKCTCTAPQIQNYRGKLSRPFLERIDLSVEVPKVQYQDLAVETKEETSGEIRERILQARTIQKERYETLGIQTNARLGIKDIEKYCILNSKEQKMMEQAYEILGLSARTYHKTLAVARTIADLDGKEQIDGRHLREALSYRMVEKHEV